MEELQEQVAALKLFDYIMEVAEKLYKEVEADAAKGKENAMILINSLTKKELIKKFALREFEAIMKEATAQTR